MAQDLNRIPPCERPSELLESHLARHSRRSQSIYLSAISLFGVGLALLPLLRVDVSIQSPGLVRPAVEKQELRTAAAGFVESVSLAPGATVRTGDELLRLGAGPVISAEQITRRRLEEAAAAVRDLRALTSVEPIARELMVSRYAREYDRFLSERDQAQDELAYAERDLTRVRHLAARRLAPDTQLEQAEVRLDRAAADLRHLEQSYRSGWQEALTRERSQLEDLQQELERLTSESERLTVRSPESGTLEQVTSLSPGTFLQAGELVAVLSPDGDLHAEVYVDPREIGLIPEAAEVRILLDAFDHRDWGFLTGRVDRIAQDFTVVNDRPVFVVQIRLDSTSLRLPSGARGELRKGMSLQARFVVASRTLWQLLRDDVSDWLDPLNTPS